MNIIVVQSRKYNKGQRSSPETTRELMIKRIKEKQSLKAEGRYKYLKLIA